MNPFACLILDSAYKLTIAEQTTWPFIAIALVAKRKQRSPLEVTAQFSGRFTRASGRLIVSSTASAKVRKWPIG